MRNRETRIAVSLCHHDEASSSERDYIRGDSTSNVRHGEYSNATPSVTASAKAEYLRNVRPMVVSLHGIEVGHTEAKQNDRCNTLRMRSNLPIK